MAGNEPISTFASTLAQALTSYKMGSLSSGLINDIYKKNPYISPTMLASTLYLLQEAEINSKSEFEKKMPSALKNPSIMKQIYARHFGKREGTAKLQVMVQMDLVRYATIYLGIKFLPAVDPKEIKKEVFEEEEVEEKVFEKEETEEAADEETEEVADEDEDEEEKKAK